MTMRPWSLPHLVLSMLFELSGKILVDNSKTVQQNTSPFSGSSGASEFVWRSWSRHARGEAEGECSHWCEAYHQRTVSVREERGISGWVITLMPIQNRAPGWICGTQLHHHLCYTAKNFKPGANSWKGTQIEKEHSAGYWKSACFRMRRALRERGS